jgi:hypothetical protein
MIYEFLSPVENSSITGSGEWLFRRPGRDSFTRLFWFTVTAGLLGMMGWVLNLPVLVNIFVRTVNETKFRIRINNVTTILSFLN